MFFLIIPQEVIKKQENWLFLIVIKIYKKKKEGVRGN
tara:strand:+ start:127 stop:237 length:111 start_codon:yes stop_codon:yes gene_type:complete